MYCITEMTHALDLFPKESIIILNKFLSKPFAHPKNIRNHVTLDCKMK